MKGGADGRQFNSCNNRFSYVGLFVEHKNNCVGGLCKI